MSNETINSAAGSPPISTRAQHTPGPWKWHWRHGDDDAPASVYAEPREGHAYAVAMMPRYQMRERWAADACLMCAAPELLEELLAARAELEAYELAATGEHYNNLKMNAAIAKATGSTP